MSLTGRPSVGGRRTRSPRYRNIFDTFGSFMRQSAVDFAEPIPAVIPGATGRVLNVLAHTSKELSARSVAQLAGVSPAQAARVLPRLAELGVVSRRDVPPASLYRLVPEHVAADALAALARLALTFVERFGHDIDRLSPRPACVAVFGSFARHQARADSDIDLLVVRPPRVSVDDDQWRATIDEIRDRGRLLSGNPIEILEVAQREVKTLIRSERPLWRDIVRDAVVVYGRPLHQLT
jgi:predicted nucleotidyltransferase